jgi:2-oxoisovalerate dehydrogenase E1 component
MDVVAVEAATRARSPRSARPGGRVFLECRTYRFRAHSMFDAQLYRDKSEVEDWREQGPIVRFQGWLLENGLIHAEDVDGDRGKRSTPRSPRPSPSPRPARWEPVET